MAWFVYRCCLKILGPHRVGVADNCILIVVCIVCMCHVLVFIGMLGDVLPFFPTLFLIFSALLCYSINLRVWCSSLVISWILWFGTGVVRFLPTQMYWGYSC